MNFFSRSVAGLTLLTALLGGSVGAEQDDRRTVLWVRLPRDPDAPAVTDPATDRSDAVLRARRAGMGRADEGQP